MTEEYLCLFSAITNALAALEALRDALMAAQIQSEEIYISREE